MHANKLDNPTGNSSFTLTAGTQNRFQMSLPLYTALGNPDGVNVYFDNGRNQFIVTPGDDYKVDEKRRFASAITMNQLKNQLAVFGKHRLVDPFNNPVIRFTMPGHVSADRPSINDARIRESCTCHAVFDVYRVISLYETPEKTSELKYPFMVPELMNLDSSIKLLKEKQEAAGQPLVLPQIPIIIGGIGTPIRVFETVEQFTEYLETLKQN